MMNKAVAALVLMLAGSTVPMPVQSQALSEAAPQSTAQLVNIRNADPSVIRDGPKYFSVESDNSSIYVRAAHSLLELNTASRQKVWGSKANVWAPEMVKSADTYYVYFAAGLVAGDFTGQRMYYIASAEPTTGYSAAAPLSLPDDRWAIDGAPFRFNDQWWFVWSGWEGDTNVEQNLYLARMSDPATVTGPRYLISRPREGWERSVGNPFINEGPEPIRDPDGQLHIVCSANGSWSTDYCLGDLRLRDGGDPTAPGDWYKSGGCLFSANGNLLMKGLRTVRNAKGVGHHTFALPGGDIAKSPPAGAPAEFLYHGVPVDLPMEWSNRHWYTGTYTWVENVMYCRSESNCTARWSLKFNE